MKSLSNRRVSVWNPDTSKEIVRFVHEVHPVFFRNPLYFLAHAMWVKWWYHANFQPFQSSFEMLFNFTLIQLKIIWKCMKNNKWSQKGLKIDDVALNGAFWTQKYYGVQISSRKWNPFVTDEFPCETLILRMRLLSVLYTKCIQFLP